MSTIKDFEAYVSAAMVQCPSCGELAGDPCKERRCRNGYRDCNYAICSYWAELEQPHLQRAVKARQERVS